MKLKPPKTWQLIVIIISAILLAIGGSILAVYLKTGFKPVNTPPEEIEVDDVDGVFNATTSQYEVVDGFKLKITTPTEEVNQNEITLSFPSGVFTTTTDDGKISDGIIIVPQKVKIGEDFNVQLVQESYTGTNGECMINKGGISKLLITTQNTKLSSSQIQIAVDVPVVDIKTEILDATTGTKLSENEDIKIAQGTNFVLNTIFYPEASRYMFSDDQNSAVATKREKRSYFNSASNKGISFNYNNGDIYFVAAEETSAENVINAYAFATAADQESFDKTSSQLSGLRLYSEAIMILSNSKTSVKTQMQIDVVEATVGSFAIKQTEGASLNVSVNKLFKLSAGESALADAGLSINILDEQGKDLSSMIKNVGLRVVSVKAGESSEITTGLENYVTVKGGKIKTYDGKSYVLINSNVKNLKHAYWEISTNGEYEIVAEIKLFYQDEDGKTCVFDQETERKVYLKSTVHSDEDVSWKDGIDENISMAIVYDKNGKPLSSEYPVDLRTLVNVPADNVYQKVVFFAYYDAFLAGEEMKNYIAIAAEGTGEYTISSGETKTLYPLQSGYTLIAKDAIVFNLVFATVRTDAYGNPIMSNGKYFIEKISTKEIQVSVTKTLQGFESFVIDGLDSKYLIENGEIQDWYAAIPTGVEGAFTLKLELKSGDGGIFNNEKDKIKFYASTEKNGEDAGVFEFGEMSVAGDMVSVPVNVKEGFDISNISGTKYYIYVEYNNSVVTIDKQAELKDYQDGIIVYNQRPASIENNALNGKYFVVKQTLETDGASSVDIYEADSSWNEMDSLGGIAGLNDLINNTNVKDCYDRVFEYNYSISSSNPKLVIANNTDHTLSFGSGEGEIDVTISAGEQKFTFHLKVSTSGVTEIKVNGEKSDNLANPKYSFSGKEGEFVTLKNTSQTSGQNGLLDVYVTGGIYDPSAYKLTLINKPEGIDSMITFTEVDGEIKSFTIIENFFEEVTLSFKASNEEKTLNFTFYITIKPYVSEELYSFNNVKYGEDTQTVPGNTIYQIGVADEDKGENIDPSATYVYAAFPINLNEYLKVRLGIADGYIDWNNAYGEQEQALEINGVEIGSLKNGELTFFDVYDPTTYTFTLYANSNNSMYAYHKEITLTVCPNFKIVQSKEFTIANLQSSKKISEYFGVARTTWGYDITEVESTEIGETSNVSTKKEAVGIDSLQISGYKFSKYFEVESEEIEIYSAPAFVYGETSKDVIVSLFVNKDGEDKVISTYNAKLFLGIKIADLYGYSTIFNPNSIVTYSLSYGQKDDIVVEAIWFSGSSAALGSDIISISDSSSSSTETTSEAQSGATTVKVEISSAPGIYNISKTQIDFSALKGNPAPILAGVGVYIDLRIKENTKDEYDIASWQIPLVLSRVGDKVASYEYADSEKPNVLDTIFDREETSIEKEYFANVEGGKNYYLIAPFEYIIDSNNNLVLLGEEKSIVFESQDTPVDFDGVSVKINENKELSINGSETGLVNTYSVGQTLTINSQNYYYKGYSSDTSGNITIVLVKSYISSKGTINVKWEDGQIKPLGDRESGTTFTIANGIYGKMLTSFGDLNLLTGLQAKDFSSEGVSVNFGAVNNQKIYTIEGNILKINDIVSESKINTYFEISQSGHNVTNCVYKFYLQVEPNASDENNVTYPFAGKVEMLEIENDSTIEIDIKNDKFGHNTNNPDKVRIADKLEALDNKSLRNESIDAGATLKIKEFSIDGQEIITNASVENAGNGVFSIAINGTKVKFTNTNAKKVNVILIREYPNVYGADVEYTFSINSSNITYSIYAHNPSNGSVEAGNNEYTWVLGNATEAQTLNITTRQLGEMGASDVDKNKVVTIMNSDFNPDEESYEVSYNYADALPKLSIKLPDFVASETTKYVYFTVNGITISTIKVVIPATVTAKQNKQSITAGSGYSYSDLVDLSVVTGETIINKEIEIVNEDSNNYVTIDKDKNSISICNAKEEQKVTLKFNYSYKGNDGYVIFTYTIEQNIAFKKSLGDKNIIAGTDFEIDFKDLLQETVSDPSDGFSLSTSVLDKNLFESIEMVDGYITVKTKPVPQKISASVNLILVYKPNDVELFRDNISVTFVIHPIVELKVNYPNPSGNENNLTYESVVSGTAYSSFLTSAAEFAGEERFQASTASLNDGTVTYSDEYEGFGSGVDKVKVKEYNNMSSVKIGEDEILTSEKSNVALNSSFTFTRGTDTGISFVVLQVTCKGVQIDYTVYVFEHVVTSSPNFTINAVDSVETIYSDRVDTTDLFNKSRLLEIEITSSAIIDSICYPYVVNLKDDKTFDSLGEQLLQFKIESKYVGKTIYVDSGKNKVTIEENQTIWFLTEKQAVSGESSTIPAVIAGVNFKRLAGRVEYKYATADGQNVRINCKDMVVNGTKDSDDNGITIYTVNYTINSATGNAETTYKIKSDLDIIVDKAYDATNSNATPTIIEIEAHVTESNQSPYRLREQVGLRHPSTGEYITAESMGAAELTFNIIDVKDEENKNTIINYPIVKGLNDRGYVFQSAKGNPYLELHDVKNGDKVYDYYLVGLGCAADGDYILLKITYSFNESTKKEFYVAIKIVPDYTVTLGDKNYEPVDGEVSNKENPYNFTPSTLSTTSGTNESTASSINAEMLIAENANGNQLVSVVRSNYDSVNIAYSFDYSITENENSEYNSKNTINKLNLTSGWSETPKDSDSGVWIPTSNDTNKIYLAPNEVVFGTKKYVIEIVDEYGYKINFYFNLIPSDEQTPTVYATGSTLSFTEGAAFDIGLIYDAISVEEISEIEKDESGKEKVDGAGNPVMKKTGYQAAINYNQIPASDTVQKIILQNIDAWGLTSPLPSDALLKEKDEGESKADEFVVSGLGDYADPPKFQNITVKSVNFKYEDDRGTSSKDGLDKTTANVITIGDGVNAASCDVGANVYYNGINYKTAFVDGKIQLTSDISGTITKTVKNEGKENEEITYKWKATLQMGEDISGTIIKDKDGDAKITYGDRNIGIGETILKIDEKTEYKLEELNLDEGTLKISGTYNTLDSGDSLYLGKSTTPTSFSLSAKVGEGRTLATEALFWPDKNNSYRMLQSGYYIVPIMDGWIYGTSNKTNVSIVIELEYKTSETTTDDVETCVVVYNAEIQRKAKFKEIRRVVTDAQEFDLASYIGVEEGGTAVYYDDTLAVTIPAQGQVQISVNIKDNDTGKWQNAIVNKNNTSTTSQVTQYLSLSELYKKTINPDKNTIEISWYGSNGATMYYARNAVAMTGEGKFDEKTYHVIEIMSGETATYKLVEFNGTLVDNSAGSRIVVDGETCIVGFGGDGKLTLTSDSDTATTKEASQIGTVSQALTLDGITKDTLYLESAERMPTKGSASDVYQYGIEKSYIIKANDTYYQYKHNYIITPKYTYLNDGLGNSIIKELKGTWTRDTVNGYTITLDQWAGADDEGRYAAVTVSQAQDSASHTPVAGASSSLAELTDLSCFVFTVGVEGEASSDAKINKDGTITTGSKYAIGNANPQYILIRVWIKASGGAGAKTPFDDENYGNGTYKKELGQVRIYLTGTSIEESTQMGNA